MRLFQKCELREAFLHAEHGGQALLLLRAPEVDSPVGRLIDADYSRLYATVSALGLRAVIAERIGLPGQSILIRGRQLSRALAACAQHELQLA